MTDRQSFIQIFQNDIIIIDGRPYTRDDIAAIQRDFGVTSVHAIEGRKSAEIPGCHTVMGEIPVSDGFGIETYNGKIVTLILPQRYLGMWIAACSVTMKGEIYDTPAGQMCDFRIDEMRKVSIGNGFLILIWEY